MPMKFREFVRRDTLSEMALGLASPLEAPITPELAQVASTAYNTADRARILQWLMTTGLYKASVARDELAKNINKWLLANKKIDPSDEQNILSMQKAYLPKGATRVVNGEVVPVSSIQSRGDRSSSSYRREGQGVFPVDVFSPEARARLTAEFGIPKEQWAKWDADYENSLPKKALVDNKFVIDLERARNKFGFKYGGVDGYMQDIEKGDWVASPKFKRNVGVLDDNKQFGPDLSFPERDIDQFGNEKYKFWGTQTYSHVGDKRFVQAITQADQKFKAIYDQIKAKSEQDPDIFVKLAQNPRLAKDYFGVTSERDQNEIARVAGSKVKEEKYAHKREDLLKAKHAIYQGDEKAAAKRAVGTKDVKVPKDQLATIKDSITNYLNSNPTFQFKNVGKLKAIAAKNQNLMSPVGQETESTLISYDDDGSWRFTKRGKEVYLSKIFANAENVPEDQSMVSLRRRLNIPAVMGMANIKLADSWDLNLDRMLDLAGVLSAIRNKDPNAVPDDASAKFYVPQEINPKSEFLSKPKMEWLPATNQMISNLTAAGYKWSGIQIPNVEDAEGSKPKGGMDYSKMSRGDHDVPLKWNYETGGWFIGWPTEEEDVPVARGEGVPRGQAALAGGGLGVTFKDDDSRTTMPVSKETGDRLTSMLLNGDLGEKAPYGVRHPELHNSKSAMDGIRNAISAASNRVVEVPKSRERGALGNKRIVLNDSFLKSIPDYEIWAGQALKSLMWNPAFVFGYSDQEARDMGLDDQKSISSKLAEFEQALKTQGMTPKQVIDTVHGEQSETDPAKTIAWLRGIDKNMGLLGNGITDVFLDQGKAARVREVGNYIWNKIKEEALSKFRQDQNAFQVVTDEEGGGGYLSNVSDKDLAKRIAMQSDDWVDAISQDKLKKDLGFSGVASNISPKAWKEPELLPTTAVQSKPSTSPETPQKTALKTQPDFSIGGMGLLAKQGQQPQPQPKSDDDNDFYNLYVGKPKESFVGFDQWRKLREAEVVAGHGPKKNKDGQGYWWAGDIAGGGVTSISGEVETVKSDPDGTKGTHGRQRKKRS